MQASRVAAAVAVNLEIVFIINYRRAVGLANLGYYYCMNPNHLNVTVTRLAERHAAHTVLQASAWVLRFAEMIPKQKAALNLARAEVLDVALGQALDIAAGQVLDLAAGSGRHSRALAAMGYAMLAVDRDLDEFAAPPLGVILFKADLELHPWPFANQQFAGVVVTNYLYRPLLPFIVAAVAPGGILIYETFAIGNEQFGRPSRAEFLLQPEELLDAVRGELQVIAYENMFIKEPKPAAVQRIAAIRKN